ncbi:MAG: type II CAAX endopeptidase family protein [Gemmatimonadaceae bacterium]
MESNLSELPTVTSPRHPVAFFVLVYALSAPFWLLSTFNATSWLPDSLPVTDIGAVLTPTIAAMILRYRESGAAGVMALLRRMFDFRSVRRRGWLLIAVVLFPLLYIITYVVMRMLSMPVPHAWHPSPTLGMVFLFFFVGAAAEELGYTAYETDALQSRMGALSAALVIGPIWALWHFPSMMQIGQSARLMAWGFLVTIAFRVISVWLYNNASRSVFAVILAHTVGNTARSAFPGGRGTYELGSGAVAYSVVIFFAALTVVLWGPKTLSQFAGRCAIVRRRASS